MSIKNKLEDVTTARINPPGAAADQRVMDRTPSLIVLVLLGGALVGCSTSEPTSSTGPRNLAEVAAQAEAAGVGQRPSFAMGSGDGVGGQLFAQPDSVYVRGPVLLETASTPQD